MIQNKKGKGLLLAFIIGLVSIFIMPVAAFAMTGSGTSADPYMIYNAADLQNMSLNTSANYKLGKDIDMVSVDFLPVGKRNGPLFSGSLDGAGYTIKNYSSSSGGIFGWTSNATIKNLTVTIENITSTQHYVGSLIGEASATSVSNVHIRKANNNSIISSSNGSIGGLIGATSSSSSITYCDSNVNVSGSHLVGGLVGYLDNTNIDKSYALGNVTGTGSGSIGGFVGSMYDASITDSFAHGDVSGNASVGGFVGRGEGDEYVANCYSAGQVNAVTSTNIGGFTGTYLDTIENCYYDNSQISNPGDPAVIAMSHEASLHQSTYIGFDFASIWKIDEGTSTPYLRDMPSPYPSTNPNLTSLSVGQNPPGLTPLFAGTTTSYTLNLGNLTVTPVAADAHATITVNGQNVVSGTPSQPIPLTSGTITIVVTAEDGVTTKTYTINI